ncbi:MAG: asparagine--tRNA ligase [Oscillospiraceae bacterium]|jgi:asparaginyl-tRNA synthetase|nr:asparagine--tRNA ligase [Oscillospiraceae bacterium]
MIRGKYTDIAKLPERDGGVVVIRGHIRANRAGARVGFIEINDGTRFAGCQVVYDSVLLADAAKHPVGAAVEVEGELVFTPESRQPFEVRADKITLIGGCDADYPMQKKRHTLEFLREIPHLRARTNTFSALFRVRDTLSAAIHEYLRGEGFMYVATPIITGSDAEGAGEVFGVTAGGDSGFFDRDAKLTVSGQLHVEPFALAYDKAYTFGPTFRAENSNTPTHAAEFWMVEPEISFADLEDDMSVMEAMVKHCVSAVLERCPDEMRFFNDIIDPKRELIARLKAVTSPRFYKMTYTEAIAELERSGADFKFPVKWGLDLKTEHERFLCEQVARGPLFITDYPKEIKAFYMRQNDDGRTVAACDLLVPGVGELIGGSQREERYDILLARMREMNIPEEPLRWYTDLRRFGSVPHSGFGLGVERFLLYLTGIGNIRDTIPYARTPGRLLF